MQSHGKKEMFNMLKKKLKKIDSKVSRPSEDSHWKIGANYFIRTVTFHYTMELVKITKQELIGKDAAWIADDGRFSQAVATGNFNEIEPFPDGEVIIGRGAILDAHVVSYKVPRDQK